MQNNFMLIEFWEKHDGKDRLIGVAKLSLHHFYITFRNPVITKHLVNSKLPVISADWWEPISFSIDGEVCGQVKILVALGTETQISYLEAERGLKQDVVTAKSVPIIPDLNLKAASKNWKTDRNEESNTDRNVHFVSKSKTLLKNLKSPSSSAQNSSRSVVKRKSASTKSEIGKKVVDIGVQSDVNMESNSNDKETDGSSSSQAQDMLGAFLTQLLTQRQRNLYVENSTNTEVDANVNQNANTDTNFADANLETAEELSNRCKNATNAQLRKTSDLLQSLQNALTEGNTNCLKNLQAPVQMNVFKAHVVVESALHLPSRKKCKSKKTKRKNFSYEDVLPSTYVTFETTAGSDLQVTPVVERSTSPQWDFRCDVTLPADLLANNQKRLIFKVWRKSVNGSSSPNMQNDIVLGFAALDLTVLLAGLPSVQGWFNIIDFSSKCNGQIKINVTPLENVTRFSDRKEVHVQDSNITSSVHGFSSKNVTTAPKNKTATPDESNELLTRALKRKFVELEEITQRLRTRLADVTTEDSDASNDEVADEFERDINTLCVEEDYDMIDLEADQERHSYDDNGCDLLRMHEQPSCSGNKTKLNLDFLAHSLLQLSENRSAGNFNKEPISMTTEKLFMANPQPETNPESSKNSSTSDILPNATASSLQLTNLDRQLIEGKQRIDTLLEKLSLMTAGNTENPFSNRYVSGCSVDHESEVRVADPSDILKNLEMRTHGLLEADTIFNPLLFEKLCSVDIDSTPSLTEQTKLVESERTDCSVSNGTSSSSSLITHFSDCRAAPDGAGNSVDNKSTSTI